MPYAPELTQDFKCSQASVLLAKNAMEAHRIQVFHESRLLKKERKIGLRERSRAEREWLKQMQGRRNIIRQI